MNVNRKLLYGGVFLVAAGGVMLAAQGNTVSDEAVAQALQLWPVALIALGVGLILRRTRVGIAGGLVAAAMPGLLLGGLVVAAPSLVADCVSERPGTFETRQGAFGGSASVDLLLACGDLTVTTVPGSGWTLETGTARGPAATVDVSTDRLRVATTGRRHPFGFGRSDDKWRLALPTATTMDLAAEVSAGHGRLDLAGARLGDVRLAVNAGDLGVDLDQAVVDHLALSVNAGSAWLRLPAGQDLRGELTVNAGALKVCAPSDLGLRVRHEGALSGITWSGVARNGDTWESPNYASAIHHADVTITANVGSVDIDPLGGCQ